MSRFDFWYGCEPTSAAHLNSGQIAVAVHGGGRGAEGFRFMKGVSGGRRTDSEAWVKWLPPEGMTGHIYKFEPRQGGAYGMALTYAKGDRSTRGKTSEDTDVVEGCFLELAPDEQIVHLVRFESNDPAFAGEMKMKWSLSPVPGGARVTITCENVPEGIRQEDHDAGLQSTLKNLSILVE
ncbi:MULTISPECIES: SRPBCC domain-containing protein [Xanthobacter]|uniref:SRPBCC domain-containing protein n=1 Tax=Xanthobacter autotrophicus TaxID=280 RepID=UPI00372BE5F3